MTAFEKFYAQQKDYFEKSFTEMHRRLVKVTKDCRPDMHEPDEQEVTASITGTSFDNAMGDAPGSGEMVVTIINAHGVTEHFNLASLIALARLAVVKYPGM